MKMAKESEKGTCSQTDTTTSRGSSRFALSTHVSNDQTVVLGSYNQADHMFSDQSRGSQCSINALCSLIYAKFSHLETRYCLDKVLLEGDIVYNKVISGLKARVLFKSKLLTLDEIPATVTMLKKDIIVEKFGVISGVCTQQFATLGLPSLYEALHNAFQKSSYLLFMIGSVCSSVFKRKDGYCFFGSHSHGPDGLSCAEGQSVLVSFPCLDDLVSLMYAVYKSMLIDVSDQFDMLPIELKLRSENVTSENSARCFMTIDACETINEEITQSYKSKPVSNSRQKEINSGKTMESKTKINLMKTIAVNSNKEQNNNTLIEKYFKDQMDRNKCMQNAA